VFNVVNKRKKKRAWIFSVLSRSNASIKASLHYHHHDDNINIIIQRCNKIKEYSHVFQWLRRGFGLVNRFIGSSLVVTTIISYTLKITVTTAHVTSHTKSSNSSSGHIAVPLELNSHSRIFSYPLGTDHAQKTQVLLLRSAEHTENESRDSYLASSLGRWLLPSSKL
jgi:hypothetical protein